jgi:hypothetical protein
MERAVARSVEAVKYALAPASGVALEHQILLYDGEKLDDARALADYGLPHVSGARRPPAPRHRPRWMRAASDLARASPSEPTLSPTARPKPPPRSSPRAASPPPRARAGGQRGLPV